MRTKPVVAIDGPSGVGKSTVARKLASALGFAFIDTGALYRAVALYAQTKGIDWEDEISLATMAESLSFSFDSTGNLSVNEKAVGDTIRTPEMALGASKVASHGEVRNSLLKVQRKLGSQGSVVLEGRDIGTRVFEDAEVKFFLTAHPHTRAKRRYLELLNKGADVELEQIEKEQHERDEADRNRAVSPLKKAADALEVKCDDMDADNVTDLMLNYINSNFPLTSK